MAGFFSVDSKLYKFMSKLTDLFKLNFIWLVFSLPIVTIGISTTAAYTVALKMAEGQEGYIGGEFLKAFKANWKQGLVMSVITIICVWAVYLDFQIFNAVEDNAVFFLIIGIVAAYILGFSLLYAYPLLARYENTVMNTLKNSFRISMKYFLRSLLLVLLVAFELAVMFWTPETLILLVLVGPAFVMLTVSSFAMIIFRELEKIPGTVAESAETESTADSAKENLEE
ncbi:MAG: YesL family protein [Oscillospiraceae bacterium]|nr:YesL family protein [Oscillospiraceae bacterium]